MIILRMLSKFITQYLNTSFSKLISVRRLEYTKNCLVHIEKLIARDFWVR